MRIARLLLPVTIAGLVLSGCAGKSGDPSPAAGASSAAAESNGVAALSADEILAKATAAAKAAGSFRMKGDVKASGNKISLDIRVKGEDANGTLSVDGARFEILKLGGKIYLKASADFWQKMGGEKGSAIAALIGDRWFTTPANDKTFSSFAEMANFEGLVAAEGKLTKGEATTINGVPVIELKNGDAGQSTLHVATSGEPYPVRVSGGVEGVVDLSEFGASFDFKEPAKDQVVDLASLMK